MPPDDPDSNHRMITEALLDAVGPVRLGPPDVPLGNARRTAASDYQAEIERLPGFDLVHLGLGPDGHTASLFPGSAALAIDDPAVLVAANRDPNANNPHDRVTLTLPGIARARLVVFTVSGSSKRDAFARRWPAPICRPAGSPPTRCCGWSTPRRPGTAPGPAPASSRGRRGLLR